MKTNVLSSSQRSMPTLSFAHGAKRSLVNPARTASGENHLLETLLAEGCSRSALAKSQRVSLPAGTRLLEAGQVGADAYFPASGIISLQSEGLHGESTQIAMIGREGFLGSAAILGADATFHHAFMLTDGSAHRLKSSLLREAFDTDAVLAARLMLYTQALISQIAMGVICNRFHTIEQQLCTRMLSMLDRQSDSRLDLTHERLANMLGVRRESITMAARVLKMRGVIEYGRGFMSVIDVPLMETASCECRLVIKREYQRLLQH